MGSLWLCGTGCDTNNIVWDLGRKGLDALSGLSQNRFLLYKSGHSVQEDCSACMFLPVLDVLGLSVFRSNIHRSAVASQSKIGAKQTLFDEHNSCTRKHCRKELVVGATKRH